jgi:phthiocerol/phenolphthiocerol synthesis type-I polyketide synthase E
VAEERQGEEARVQRIVGAIWEKELGVARVLPESDFFELGGDSLRILNMLLRLEAELGIEVAAGALFQAPTLHEFCALLAGELRRVAEPTSSAFLEGTL